MFIKEFLSNFEDPDTIVVAVDEMGYGTKPLRRYGYSKIGTPAVTSQKQ